MVVGAPFVFAGDEVAGPVFAFVGEVFVRTPPFATSGVCAESVARAGRVFGSVAGGLSADAERLALAAVVSAVSLGKFVATELTDTMSFAEPEESPFAVSDPLEAASRALGRSSRDNAIAAPTNTARTMANATNPTIVAFDVPGTAGLVESGDLACGAMGPGIGRALRAGFGWGLVKSGSGAIDLGGAFGRARAGAPSSPNGPRDARNEGSRDVTAGGLTMVS